MTAPPPTHAERYLAETRELLAALDAAALEAMAARLVRLREGGGRLFALGVGGSAAHASHAVNDFRKLCGIEAYAPTDNAAELTARANDEGWETVFSAWLRVSRLGARDALLVFSVGGGDAARNISPNIVAALKVAREAGASVLGVVGRDGGATARAAEVCIVVPPLFPERVTPHTEGLCAVLWHALVCHPALARGPAKWEGAVR